jgi:hypothetical protein
MTPQTAPSTPVFRLCCYYQWVTAYGAHFALCFLGCFWQLLAHIAGLTDGHAGSRHGRRDGLWVVNKKE